MQDQPVPPSGRRAGANTLDKETFGRRLRVARKQLGWTLAQLSERSGVSIPTISRAERGQLALGYDNFAALGQALQMDMGQMFSSASAKTSRFKDPVVTRAGEGVAYRGESFVYEFLGTTAVGKKMIHVLGTVHARTFNGPEDFARHPGEEFVYILSGTVDVYFDTGETLRLTRGDSLYFDSRIGHAYVSVSRQLARTIGAMTGESDSAQKARERHEPAAAETPTGRGPAASAKKTRRR